MLFNNFVFMKSPLNNDTICALSTPPGTGAIAVIRVSGKDALEICGKVFRKKKSTTGQLSKFRTHTVHHGEIVQNNIVIDDVVIALFKAPKSYTGEHVVEISCHGSQYIQQQILQLLIKHG